METKAGRGGGGLVWRVTDIDTNALTALKFYSEAANFNKEVQVLKRFNHPNIVELIDAFEQDPETVWYPYSVGIIGLGIYSLQDNCRYQRPLRLTKIKFIMEDVLAGIRECHSKGIVHADLKPANIMFFRDSDEVERWKLIDFDSSCFVGEPVSRGTVDYSAPEVIRAIHTQDVCFADPAIDMFALGRVIQWLSGKDVSFFWPHLDDMATQTEKEMVIMSEDEFQVSADDVEHTPTRNLIQSLIRKSPKDRMTLPKLISSSFFTMNLDTAVLRSFPQR